MSQSNKKAEVAWLALRCSSDLALPRLPLPCCLPLVNVDFQLQPQDDGPSPLGCLRAGPVGYESELQGRGADRPVPTCYLTLGKLPPPSETSGKTNRVEIEIQEAVILCLSPLI